MACIVARFGLSAPKQVNRSVILDGTHGSDVHGLTRTKVRRQSCRSNRRTDFTALSVRVSRLLPRARSFDRKCSRMSASTTRGGGSSTTCWTSMVQENQWLATTNRCAQMVCHFGRVRCVDSGRPTRPPRPPSQVLVIVNGPRPRSRPCKRHKGATSRR
jgi:hypothetical protein